MDNYTDMLLPSSSTAVRTSILMNETSVSLNTDSHDVSW